MALNGVGNLAIKGPYVLSLNRSIGPIAQVSQQLNFVLMASLGQTVSSIC